MFRIGKNAMKEDQPEICLKRLIAQYNGGFITKIEFENHVVAYT